jgi:hypothetical protein
LGENCLDRKEKL